MPRSRSSTPPARASRFTKDVVLKGGLVLSDIGDIRFKVTNFNQQNMHTLEQGWDCDRGLPQDRDRAARVVRLQRPDARGRLRPPAARLLRQDARARRVVSDVERAGTRTGRQVRAWVLRSLLKAGIWGSGQDTLLARLRDAIRQHGEAGIPGRPDRGGDGADWQEPQVRRRGDRRAARPAVRQAAHVRHALAAVPQVQLRDGACTSTTSSRRSSSTRSR